MAVEVNRTRAVLVVVGVLAAATLMAGCTVIVAANLLLGPDPLGDVETAEYATLDDWPAAADFADRFELDLPPSARDVKIASSGFQEPVYHLRFTVDAEDAALVATSVGCSGLIPQPVSDVPDALVDGLDWWVPERATSYQGCSGGATPGRFQDVFFDQTRTDTVDVYVRVVYV
ncbi:MAG: hypothetical protein ACFCVK_11075 [Acidimicrobiales bacterium]